MHAVAPALRGHDVLAAAPRGRSRAVSEVCPPQPDRERETSQLPKAASYTYFPRVKDLVEEPAVLELKGTISEVELKSSASADGTSYTGSDGSSADSEDGPQADHMPQLKPSNSRRSSRFNPFYSKAREPSVDPKPNRARSDSLKRGDSPSSVSPVRSLSKLRRKSWISSQSRSSSPTREATDPVKEDEHRKNPLNLEASKRRSLTAGLSIPEKARTRDAAESPTTHKGRVLTKKTKRLSGLFNAANIEQPPPVPNTPSVPAVPKSFSTEKLPSYVQSPTSPTHIPPLPATISSDKLKGPKTEPRKKDELWTVFRTLEGDLRKYENKHDPLFLR